MNGPDLYRIKDAALIFPSQLLCKYYVNIIDKRPTANDNSTIQTSTLDTMKNVYMMQLRIVALTRSLHLLVTTL